MRLSDYLKDRSGSFLIAGCAWLMTVIFLCAFHTNIQAVIIVSVIMLLALAGSEALNFIKRKRFYDSLESSLNGLDKKYLIAEMLEEPDFTEGKILCNTIHETDKAMLEHINEYKLANEQFREYLEMWVHEVKLPVASLQLMCHNDGNTRYSSQLHRIDDYIENVLYYARSGSAEKDYVIRETSLKRVFADTAIRCREELQERGVGISTEGLDTSVMTDSKWLGYIFGQLISNSMKYFSPDRTPEITVKAETSPDTTILRFRDNGIGIPESDLPYIFEKSFTGQNGRTHTKSTGMGLYIIKKLCSKLGHSITAESVQNSYTEIIITFGNNDLLKMS
ncbi:MAG: sensor histidine kinase [Ruminococcus sp.]|nr:sensor histidine kinase [Ruminococcus sp.]